MRRLFGISSPWTSFLSPYGPYAASVRTIMYALHYWVDQFEYSEARVLAAWDHRGNYWTDVRRTYLARHAPTPREVQNVFVKRVARVIQQNPNVQFDLLLLPATVLEYGMDFRIRRGRFESRLSLNEAVARVRAQLPNVRGFQLPGR